MLLFYKYLKGYSLSLVVVAQTPVQSMKFERSVISYIPQGRIQGGAPGARAPPDHQK